MAIIRDEEIGGGSVLRTFTMHGESLKVGTPLSRAALLSIPYANRQALIDGGKIAVYPPSSERHVVSDGFGHYSVYAGRKLNDKPLTKAQAQKLAGIEPDPEPTVN